MSSDARQGYGAGQVGLHWIIAALILFQLVFGESSMDVADPVTVSEQQWIDAHYWIGIAVLGLAVVRPAMRVLAGAPAPIRDDWTATAAGIVHGAFYVLIFATPILGLLGWYVGSPWDDIHALNKPLFIVLIGVHAGAALYHHFWLKDGTLRRMLVPAA
jgi:cytochrome b561